MNLNREGELGNVPMRSDRFFSADSAWYFSTREGTAIGPFDSKRHASRGLNDFLEFLGLAKPKVLAAFFKSLASGNVRSFG